MRSSAKQLCEFPALFMTVLFIGASLSSIVSLRLMTQQATAAGDPALHAPYYISNVQFPPTGSESNLSSESIDAKKMIENR